MHSNANNRTLTACSINKEVVVFSNFRSPQVGGCWSIFSVQCFLASGNLVLSIFLFFFFFYHFNVLIFITLLVVQWCQEDNKSSRHNICKAGGRTGLVYLSHPKRTGCFFVFIFPGTVPRKLLSVSW